MSWSSYIDNLKGTGHISSAAIVGVKDGGNIWAADPSLHIQPQEIENLIKGFGPSSTLSQNGIRFSGVKYFFLQAGDDQIQGKKGQGGITIGKSDQCMIIAIYSESQQPGNARNAVEKMVSYLKSMNY